MPNGYATTLLCCSGFTTPSPPEPVAQAWNALARIFVDNKPTRAVYLRQKFSNTKLSDFSSVSAYCQELKHLSDQLTNVDAPVNETDLVLQLIAGLNMEYDTVATALQQSPTLPSFESARSRLSLEETRKAHQTPTANLTAAAPHPPPNPPPPAPAPTVSDQHQQPYQGRNSETRGRGRGGRRGGRGRGRGRGNNGNMYYGNFGISHSWT